MVSFVLCEVESDNKNHFTYETVNSNNLLPDHN